MRIAGTFAEKRTWSFGQGPVRPVAGVHLQTLEGHAIILPTRPLNRRATADEIGQIAARRPDGETLDRTLAPGFFVDILA